MSRWLVALPLALLAGPGCVTYSVWERTTRHIATPAGGPAPRGFDRLEAWQLPHGKLRLRFSSSPGSEPAGEGRPPRDPNPREYGYWPGSPARESGVAGRWPRYPPFPVVADRLQAASQAGDVLCFDGAEVIHYRNGQPVHVRFVHDRRRDGLTGENRSSSGSRGRGTLAFALIAPLTVALDLVFLPVNVWIWLGLVTHHR